jgi:hypothetical protein
MQKPELSLISIACIMLALLASSCSSPGPKPPAIPEERFVDCYAQLLVAHEEGVITSEDSLRMKARSDSLCASFGLTRTQVDEELRNYREDPARWKGILDRIISRLQVMEHEKPPPGKRGGALAPPPPRPHAADLHPPTPASSSW